MTKLLEDDPLWLPQVPEGKLVRGDFIFGEGDTVKEHKVESVKSFPG